MTVLGPLSDAPRSAGARAAGNHRSALYQARPEAAAITSTTPKNFSRPLAIRVSSGSETRRSRPLQQGARPATRRAKPRVSANKLYEPEFAASSALGILTGAVSQAAFALAYAWSARRLGWKSAILAASSAFALATWAFQSVTISAAPLF